MTTHVRRRRQQGFTLMETMVALGVLTVGILGISQVMAYTLSMSSDSSADLIAHQKATEAVESVFTARDTRTITWDRIRNVVGQSGMDNGVFLDGPRALTTGGADGLMNTADDGNVEVVMQPGPDGQLGTADDVAAPLANFQREIRIRDVPGNPSLRTLRVTISYRSEQRPRQFVIDTFISQFS